MADENDPISLASEGDGVVPVARPAGSGGASPPPKGRIDAKPIFDLAETPCPRCGAPMPDDAVVCMKCGYDMKSNVVLTPEVGVEYASEKKSEVTGGDAGGEFVVPGRGDAKTIAIVGAALTVIAMILAGVFAEPRVFGLVSAMVLLVLYQTLLHTGTGVAAVMVAANFCEERFTRPELAAARMLTAFAAFQAVRQIVLPVAVVGRVVPFVLALGVYFLVIWVLFRRDRVVTGIIALSHAILWALVELGMLLSWWVAIAAEAAAEAAAKAGSAGA